MKMTIDSNKMKDMFKTYNRDYFTYEAYESLLNYYDEIDDNIDFDPIAICCDWNEYGETPCLKWSDFLSDYGYILDDIENSDELTDDEKIDVILDELENKTIVIRLSDSVLIQTF